MTNQFNNRQFSANVTMLVENIEVKEKRLSNKPNQLWNLNLTTYKSIKKNNKELIKLQKSVKIKR